MNNIPLALYVHLPWCVRKCPYCDFNSHEIKNGSFPEREYVDAVVRDIKFSAGLFRGRKLESVFLGGGTPSLISVQGIAAILEAADAVSGLCSGTEITLEANPGAADSLRFAGYRGLGVNRLSIGAQSFDNHKLKSIGRIHDAAGARSAVAAGAAAGFADINVDLMYGLPGQTAEDALADLSAAVSLESAHISWYQLTIEPNTLFHAKPPPLPGDDLTWEMQNCGEEYLAGQGYRQYEVSAWSRPGSECRHNLNYWEFGDYIGVGAGAHGKITNGTVTRQSRLRVPQSYMRAAGSDAAIAAKRTLNEQDCILEFMLNALRLKDGVPLSRFSARTGLAPARVQAQVDAARADGLLEDEPSLLKATEKGARYLNDLLQYFMS